VLERSDCVARSALSHMPVPNSSAGPLVGFLTLGHPDGQDQDILYIFHLIPFQFPFALNGLILFHSSTNDILLPLVLIYSPK
jgi:hypothetical protein